MNSVAGSPSFSIDQYAKILAILQQGTAQPLVQLAGIALSSIASSTDDWVIDSGANEHMCSSSNSLCSSEPPSHSLSVQMPNGSHADISTVGSISFSPDLHLDNVLHVPSFKFNLLSISKITKSLNCSVSFFADFCIF